MGRTRLFNFEVDVHGFPSSEDERQLLGLGEKQKHIFRAWKEHWEDVRNVGTGGCNIHEQLLLKKYGNLWLQELDDGMKDGLADPNRKNEETQKYFYVHPTTMFFQ